MVEVIRAFASRQGIWMTSMAAQGFECKLLLSLKPTEELRSERLSQGK